MQALSPMPKEATNTTIVVESVPSIESIWQEWSDLALRADNLFLTPEWASIWWLHYGGDHELCLRACRNGDGQLVAIFPLYVWRRRPRVLRFLGHGPGDELGPLVAPEERSLAATELVRVLSRENCDVLLAERLPGLGDWSSLLAKSRVLRREASPVIAFEYSSWEDYLRSRSTSLRRSIGRCERAVRDTYRVRFRLTADSERLSQDVDELFSLHREQWRRKPTDFDGRDQAFQREFIAKAHERGWLRLLVLELDERPAVTMLLYRFAGVDYAYQIARNQEFDRFSVGFLTINHALRTALEDGMREFRFLRGGESYKSRFTTTDRGLETLALARGPIGNTTLLGLQAYLPFRRILRGNPLRRR